jgi:tripartite-type tricarboxylate transporter receptor subunit TctC
MMAKSRGLFAVLTALPVLALAVAPAAAQTVADFYRGKTLTMVVGTSPGGDYDLRLRMVARHIGRHIPGNPTVVVNNMPGGGGLVVANWLANVAPKDGSVVVAVTQNLPVHQATGAAGIKFDVREFNWIGNTTDTPNVINSWHTTGIRTIQDVMTRELIVGATGTASGSFLYPYALNRLVGTKFKIVTGYPGGNDVNLAMERGEVGGRGSNSWASWKSTRPQWLAEKKVFILVQVGVKRNPELPDVPTLQDLAKNDGDRQVLEFISADTAISRPLVTNAGVPRERVAALRRAFDATMKDAEFLAEAEKSKTDISPMTGEEAQKIAVTTINTPPDVLARANALIEGR